MTNERLKDLYIRGVEQDFRIPGGKSFFYQICSRKISVIGEDEGNLQNWKQTLLGELDYGKASIKLAGGARSLPLFDKIAYCEKRLIDPDWSSIYQRRAAEYSTMNKVCLYPLRDLFLWCLLFRRVEMAKVLWSTSDDGLVYALAAAVLCRKAAMIDERDTDVHDRYKADAYGYESAALGVFQEAYSKDRSKAYKLLTRVSDCWGNRTCLELAIAGKCRDFMSQVGVQELLSMIWRGNIHLDQHYGPVYLSLALPMVPFLPSKLITFDADDKNATWIRKFLWVFQAPVSVFYYNVVFFVIYLMFFATVIVAKFCIRPHWTEWVLIGWTGTLIFEEIRQILHEPGSTKIKTWWRDLYNKFDFLGYIIFIIGIVLKFTTYNSAVSDDENCPLSFDDDIFFIAHIFYCLSFIVLMIRMMSFYSNSRRLGPKVLMVTRMFMDMVQFLALLIIFILAYGIATQGILYPNEWRIDEILYGIIYTPYFQIYGELFIAERTTYPFEDGLSAADGTCIDDTYYTNLINNTDPQRCPNKHKMVEVLQALYMLIANVLLLNLLIALFSNTFEQIQANAEKYWKFQRYSLIREYYYRPTFVPPFILISHGYNLVRYVYSVCCGKHNTIQGWYKYNTESFTSGIIIDYSFLYAFE